MRYEKSSQGLKRYFRAEFSSVSSASESVVAHTMLQLVGIASLQTLSQLAREVQASHLHQIVMNLSYSKRLVQTHLLLKTYYRWCN